MNTVFRNFIAGCVVFIFAACEIGPIDSVDIVEVSCRDTVILPDTPELSDYPLSYTITVNYNSSLFKGELVLMFNTDDPEVFQENNIYGWNSVEPPNRFTAEKGEGTHTFDVYVKKPLWMMPSEPENETLLDTATQREAADNLAANAGVVETSAAVTDRAIAANQDEETPQSETPVLEPGQSQATSRGDWKAVVYLQKKFGEKMVQSESVYKLPLPSLVQPPPAEPDPEDVLQ